MSMIFNGVGLLITDSKILLARLQKKENSFLIGNFLSANFDAPLNQSTGEIIFLSQLEEICEEPLRDAETIRVALPQNLYRIFSFPYEEKLSRADLREQIKWEISRLFPETDVEKFVPTYFISENKDYARVNVIVAEKKFLEIIFKFALRKNIGIEFFEHPAIATLNAFNAINKMPDILIYASDGFLTGMALDGGKIKLIRSLPFSSDAVSETIEAMKPFVSNSAINLVLTGSEISEEILAGFSGSDYNLVETDFNEFHETEIDKSDLPYLPALTGLLLRVK